MPIVSDTARKALVGSNAAFSSLAAGDELPASSWVIVDQAMIDRFGHATLDPDPQHIDPVWARAHGAFGDTIAFGFLTIGLLTHLLHSSLGTSPLARDHGEKAVFLNYGFDRMRLIEPVPVNSRLRGRFIVKEVRLDTRGRSFVTFDCKIEIDGVERPALAADWLTVRIPAEKS